jgi:hypothetical protein
MLSGSDVARLETGKKSGGPCGPPELVFWSSGMAMLPRRKRDDFQQMSLHHVVHPVAVGMAAGFRLFLLDLSDETLGGEQEASN